MNELKGEKDKNMRNKGITLIALVITIIVLLILAGVSIATLTGQNGILTRANDAKEQTGIAEEKEAINLAYSGAVAEKRGTGDITADDLNREFGTNGTNATATDNGDGTITVTFDPPSNRVYTIDSNGNITEEGTNENPGGGQTGGVQPGEIVETTEKENYTDPDGDKATVPAGFVVSKIPEEQDVSDGLVIYDIPEDELADVDWTTKNPDGAYQVQTLYNQFVWIPVEVEKDEDFKTYEGYWDGDLDSMLADCDEPYVTETYKTEETEYNDMRASVLDYDGFYVGRYESGIESSTERQYGAGIEDDVVIKQGKNVYNYIGWSSSDDMTVQTGGAVQKSKEFGEENGYSVTSTLIYGVQWDAIMAWIDPAYKTGSCESTSFVADSTGKGYYDADAPTTTGSSSAYAVKNIYDLAGNVYEWTMESYDARHRVLRGGSYRISGSKEPASIRNSYSPSDDDYGSVGFRVTLYL